MRNFFSKIHLWLSFPAGIIISLICITGATLVFATEISETIYPKRYFAEKIQQKPMTLDILVPMVNSQLNNNTVASVQIPSDPKRNYVMALTKGKRVSAYVDPYTGKVVEIYSYLDSFFGKVMGLHRWLLFGARDIGRNIVGYVTLLTVLIIISGIAIWWPKTKTRLKKRLRISTKNGAKRLIYDLHSSLGIYLSIGFLVLALTGLTWSFDWYRQGFYAAFGVKMEKKGEKQEGRSSENGVMRTNYAAWETALKNIKKTASDYKSITIGEGTASVSPLSQYGNEMRADKYSIDPATGIVKEIKLYSEAPRSNKIRGWIYSVHVGAWGGLASKILTFLIALLAGTLPLTGYYIYYFKRKKRWQRKEG